ncbi:sensor histidine kinase [Paenibacillus agaridevorans]|nr:histidine kinase [Paenibacillus agaridevorans]
MKVLVLWQRLYVFQKVIVVFAIVMLPVLLIILWMNMSAITIMKKQSVDSNLSSVAFFTGQLNDQISFIRRQQLKLLNNSDLQKIGFLGSLIREYEDYQMVTRVREELTAIRSSSEYISSVGTAVLPFGYTISTNNGITKLPNPESELIEFYQKHKQTQPLYYFDNKLYFMESANNGNILVYVELSIPRLEQSLQQLLEPYKDSGASLVNDALSHVVSIQPNSFMWKNISTYFDDERDNLNPSIVPHVEHENYLITRIAVSSLGLTLYTYLNQDEITDPINQFNYWLVILTFLSLAIVVLFGFSLNWMIHKPLKRLTDLFNRVEADNLIRSSRPQQDSEFNYLYRNFDKMMDKLRQSIQENYEQKIALQYSEMKQMQSQINPHFLYNSFFNLYMICKSGDMESAALMAQKLGGYYQFITRNGKDEVTLEEEYQHALDYCEIQSIRFANRITVEIAELEGEFALRNVPRLIVQPLVENAFEHAFDNGTRRGVVRISARCTEHILHIKVEDDGQYLTDDRLQELQVWLAASDKSVEKTGLINVHRRIRLKYGEESGVVVSRSESGGMKAELWIDFKGGANQDVQNADCG